jgi:hypothetical protein
MYRGFKGLVSIRATPKEGLNHKGIGLRMEQAGYLKSC